MAQIMIRSRAPSTSPRGPFAHLSLILRSQSDVKSPLPGRQDLRGLLTRSLFWGVRRVR